MLERPQINTWVMQRCIHHLAGDTWSFQSQPSPQVSHSLLWIVWRGGFVVLKFVLLNDTFFPRQKITTFGNDTTFPTLFFQEYCLTKHTGQMPIKIKLIIKIITFPESWMKLDLPILTLWKHTSINFLFQRWLHISAEASDHCIFLTYLSKKFFHI